MGGPSGKPPGACMDHPDLAKARRALLPTWLKILSFLFLVFLLAPVILLGAVVSGGEFTGNAYGLSYSGPPLAPLALLIDAVLFLHGVAAFGLLWGRQWGPTAGIGVCSLGLSISLHSLVASGFPEIFLAPLVQTIVLLVLIRLRKRWAIVPADLTAEVFA